jgi:toxin ParE1/3/4
MRAHFTRQAEIDLEEVGDYIALDNPRRAVSFIREIRQHCEKIADGPRHYVARPDLGDPIRICAHGNYLIVFEPFDDGALILRVHPARLPVTAGSLAIYTQTVLQGGFVLSKARGDRGPLLEALAHLKNYITLLFHKETVQ